MRYRILASFQGAPYEAGVGPDESDVVLFAACPPPEALKFEPATGHWRKRVSRAEVQTLYESRPVGKFRGEQCIVLDDLSDRLHIVYLGHDALRAGQLGYWEVDRGVFELITPRHEVTDIVEQRRPLPIRSGSGQHTRPGPMPSERPDDYGAANGNGLPYSWTDAQLYGDGNGGHDEFATGRQLLDQLDQRASVDGLQSTYSQDLPITGPGRSEPSMARPADRSDVTIPPVPEPPLPLEAEALRAASNSARREQKSRQSRPAQDARVSGRPQPAIEPQVQAAPAQAPAHVLAEVPAEPVQAANAPAGVTIAPAEVTMTQAQATDASQPQPAPVPAAATLTKAAMLSHAAATAARLAAASSKQAPGSAPLLAEQASPAPEQVGVLSIAEAPAPTLQSADAGAHVDQPTAGQLPVSEPTAVGEPDDVLAQGSAGPPNQDAVPAAASAPPSAPVPPAAEAAPVSAPAPLPPPGQHRPTSLGLPMPAPGAAAEPAPTTSADAMPAPSTQVSPDYVSPDYVSSDYGDGAAGAPLVGISDPPSVAHPPAASPVPSWTPQGPVPPQPGFEVAQSVQPTHDIAPGHVGSYAPYVASEPVSRNGTATANGTATPLGLGRTAPMPIHHPGLAAPSTFMVQPEPVQPSDETSEPAGQAKADPTATTRRRRSTKRRLPTQKIFSDLATQAAIPATAYAIGEDVDGAMCLVRTNEGFEVFNAAAGARHEVRVFQDEESAYFYLFGVLVAESVRTGALVPRE
jgi:hypothetical protein